MRECPASVATTAHARQPVERRQAEEWATSLIHKVGGTGLAGRMVASPATRPKLAHIRTSSPVLPAAHIVGPDVASTGSSLAHPASLTMNTIPFTCQMILLGHLLVDQPLSPPENMRWPESKSNRA